ncbi:MAG: glycosyl hydrolase [Saprospiraceae bacterium]|nr:glycosyl hydrolase [Saprospiraceae bacterium]
MNKLLIILLAFTPLFSFAQVKINSSTFGSMEPRAMGPGTMSGRITAIEGNSKDGRTIYIGTAGGGIWKSTNAGSSYSPVFDKYCQSIGAIALDPNNPEIIYTGTGESNMRNSVSIGNGMYKSTDAGSNWVKIGLDSTEHISKIVIDPKNTSTLYVAVPGPLWSDSPHRGLYKSDNGGKSWQKILYINEKTGCADICINPLEPNIIYASTWEFRRTPYSFNSGGKGSALYKSIDGGKNWKKISNGLPSGDFGRIAMALAPSEPDQLIAIVESSNTGLYISRDAGENWKQQSSTMNVVSRPFYFSTIIIDPKDPKRVYRPAFTLSYSDDGGYSFSDVSNEGGWVHSDHHALWINPNNTNHMFLGTDGGVYISNDRGASFLFCGNLPVGQFYHVAVDEQEPYRIYGGLQDNGSWIAPSEKAGGVSNGDWSGLYWGDGFWTEPDLTDSNTCYAEYQGGNAARIDLSTKKTYSIQPQKSKNEDKLRWNWNTPIVTGNANKKNLYMGAQYLYKSTDQGRNWTRISADLTTNDPQKLKQEESGGISADNTSAENHCTIFTLSESPFDERIIYVGTDDGNLQITKDGGINWKNVSSEIAKAGIPSQTWISSIHLSKFDVNTVFVTLDNHMYGDHNTYLIKSTDGGNSWSRIFSKEFTGFAHKIIQDRQNPNLFFLGTEMGLFSSLDGGINWFRMKTGFPDYALVRDIRIHNKTNALIIGTHGRGIYIYDDISAMRNMNSDLANREVYLFNNNEVIINDGKYGGATPFTGGWIAGNPESITSIQYYLKDRILDGAVKVDILDEDGKLVKNIPASQRKGINKVYWDYRMKPPRVAEGGTKLDFAGFSAPQVLPGKYIIRLNVKNKDYLDTIQLNHKDEKNYNLEDRKAQYETSMKFYNMHESLAKTVENISAEQKFINETKVKAKNKKTIQLADQYYKSLEDLKTTLLASKQKSIFADEKKLREEISESYGVAVSGQQRPSNTVISAAEDLSARVDAATIKYSSIKSEYRAKYDKALTKEKIIQVMKP